MYTFSFFVDAGPQAAISTFADGSAVIYLTPTVVTCVFQIRLFSKKKQALRACDVDRALVYLDRSLDESAVYNYTSFDCVKSTMAFEKKRVWNNSYHLRVLCYP